MPSRDPYEVLGVAKTASADDIKSSYRRLARRFHPDVNPDDPSAKEKFQEIGEAYSILSDPAKRDRFDRFGMTDDQPSDPFFGGGMNVGDLFEAFFGGAGGNGRRSTAHNGEDLRYDMGVTLTDVLNGTHREITFERMAECSSCSGTGMEGGKPRKPCPTCNGQGAVTSVRNTFIGQVRTQTTCPQCRGEGALIDDPCKTCQGRGLRRETAAVTINVPPGFEDGATIHVPGQGNDGTAGGRPGDLYVVLDIEADKRFERRNQTLLTHLELTYAQAALGDQIEIDGLDGRVELNIPAGTQPGTRLTVKQGGLPPLHGGRRGDLIVAAQVQVPKKLNEAQIKLIRELAEVGGERMPQGEEKGGLLGGLFGKKR